MRAAGSIVAAGGAWLGYHIAQGNINPGGRHRYDREWRLGPVQNYGGGVVEYWAGLCVRPNGRFPMTRVNGVASEPGAVMHLQFWFESPNPVIVDEVDDHSMTLVTAPGHLFRGTARHSVREDGGDLLYRIQGEGPVEGGENLLLQAANVGFAQFGWPLNMTFAPTEVERAIDAAERLNA